MEQSSTRGGVFSRISVDAIISGENLRNRKHYAGLSSNVAARERNQFPGVEIKGPGQHEAIRGIYNSIGKFSGVGFSS